jgi:hypothetical protein
LDQVNGIYNLFGESNGVGAYTNGICIIEKGEGSEVWVLMVGYCDGFADLYRNDSDTDYPPSTGWTAFNTKYSPAPIIISKKAE